MLEMIKCKNDWHTDFSDFKINDLKIWYSHRIFHGTHYFFEFCYNIGSLYPEIEWFFGLQALQQSV